MAVCLISLGAVGCFRGKLPPREFYRLASPDSVLKVPRPLATAPLTGAIAIARFETPGIYGSGSIVYRVGTSEYGTYPSREWAIPLGEMLASLSENILERRALTSGRVSFDPGNARRDPYEWRGAVREFDEVDASSGVSASVAISAQLVRVADDSVLWSGSAHEVESIGQTRSMDAVIVGLSTAAARALSRLADDAGATLRRLAAAGAQGR
jgi:ABC-type uncharacterized transport system auxiliary subunit